LAFGAGIADLIFTMQPDAANAVAFATRAHKLVREGGRAEESIRILHGVSPILGRTQAQADERAAYLRSLIDIPTGLTILGRYLPGVDLHRLYLDRPIPPELVTASTKVPAGKSVHGLLAARIAAGQVTLRELVHEVATARGHWSPVTTPDGLIDAFSERAESGAADGFVLIATDLGEGLRGLLDELLPRMRERGWLGPVPTSPVTLRQRLTLHTPPAVPILQKVS
jgi:alkanesulfonate monooxygenase SsuD/methylene tetrahydromethanopterin reductase-like flavin-dependent oxidoreductase (luciferase family)